MSLLLPPKFHNDIKGRDTSLVPVVMIGNSTGSDYANNYFISTGSTRIKYGESGQAWSAPFSTKPILLNIPSIKESFDLNSRKYKISSVNLEISNFPYEGKRFSETVATSLLNTKCRIYWVSPSANGIFPFDIGVPSVLDDEAFFVYYGIIRKYNHDDNKTSITVEDESQAHLHKD